MWSLRDKIYSTKEPVLAEGTNSPDKSLCDWGPCALCVTIYDHLLVPLGPSKHDEGVQVGQ